jgi:predicted enzyme related to lactoylglutathione lyase
MASPLLGRPVWYELLTTDMAGAEKFYTAVVGWTTTAFDGAPQPYKMWMRSGQAPIGGVMTIPDGMSFPPHWEMYIGVPKLEDAVSKIERGGGGAMGPLIEVPTVGRMQTMRDPQGAVFAIHEPASPGEMAPEAPPEIGEVSWIELMTTDAPAARAFYREQFGWKDMDTADMGPIGMYYMFGRDVGMLGGMFNRSAEMAQIPPNWLLYFRVPEINAGADRITANGGQIVNGPMEVPGGDWIVQGMDPQGAAFALHAKKS